MCAAKMSKTIYESYCILLPKHLSEWDIKVGSKCEFEVNCASPRFPMVMLLFHNYQCDITAANLDNNKRNYSINYRQDFKTAAISILTLL